jgi:hypothetical protein
MSSIVDQLSINDRVGQSGAAPPRESILDIAPPSLDAMSKMVSVVPISSNSVGPSQTISLMLGSRNAMRNASAYLRFKFSWTDADRDFSFATAYGGAQALINSAQLSVGGIVLEQINNFHHYAGNVIHPHCMTNETLINTAMSEGSYSPGQFTQMGNYSATNMTGATLLPQSTAYGQFRAGSGNHFFAIDLPFGLTHNKNGTLIPLFAMNNTLITLQTNPITRAFYSNNAVIGNNFTYTISDMELVYQEVVVPEEYISSVRSGLNNNKLIKIESQSVLNVQVGGAQSIQQLFSLNLSSLDAILWGAVSAADTTATPKWFQATANEKNNPAVRYEVYVDGDLLYSSARQLCDPEVAFRELKRALSGSISPVDNTPIVQGIGVTAGGTFNGSYANQAYLRALSTRKWIDDGTSMNGSKVNTVRIQFQNNDYDSNTYIQLFFVYSYVMLLDGTGSVSKVM